MCYFSWTTPPSWKICRSWWSTFQIYALLFIFLCPFFVMFPFFYCSFFVWRSVKFIVDFNLRTVFLLMTIISVKYFFFYVDVSIIIIIKIWYNCSWLISYHWSKNQDYTKCRSLLQFLQFEILIVFSIKFDVKYKVRYIVGKVILSRNQKLQKIYRVPFEIKKVRGR